MGLYGIKFILYGIMGVPVGIRGASMGLGWNYGGFYGILWDLGLYPWDDGVGWDPMGFWL